MVWLWGEGRWMSANTLVAIWVCLPVPLFISPFFTVIPHTCVGLFYCLQHQHSSLHIFVSLAFLSCSFWILINICRALSFLFFLSLNFHFSYIICISLLRSESILLTLCIISCFIQSFFYSCFSDIEIVNLNSSIADMSSAVPMGMHTVGVIVSLLYHFLCSLKVLCFYSIKSAWGGGSPPLVNRGLSPTK